VTAARVGTGFDAHRLVEGRPLMLGGVRIEHARGLEGHSDGDCLLHAICDAILGALGAGDMGRHFPSTDARWKGAASLRFLEDVARLLAERGYALGNLDATVIAEAPALAPHLDAMRTQIAQVLAVPLESVSVKAKSTDALGAIGRGEGIAAQAVVLLQRRER
jgi:2-C-methyl-D-erythritol 4-phosphate cytidylyltransferase/2-C-methyl-D-erythritol 2,4-cyclodiphosphate synthase